MSDSIPPTYDDSTNTIDPTAHLAKVFVGNLDFATTADDLTEWFNGALLASASPAVLTASIITRYKKSAGYGFVTFTTVELANLAASSLHKAELAGRTVNVEMATPQKPRDPATARPPRSSPVIGADGQEVPPAPRKRVRKRGPKKSPVDALTAAMEGTRISSTGTESDGDATAFEGAEAPAASRKREPRAPREKKVLSGIPSDNVIYVGNLPYSMGDEELASIFHDFSVVEATVVKAKWNDRSKGFGFVTLASNHEQARVLNELQGVVVGDRPLTIKIAMANQTKEDSSAAAEGVAV